MPPGNEVVFEKLPNVVANWLAMLLRMPPQPLNAVDSLASRLRRPLGEFAAQDALQRVGSPLPTRRFVPGGNRGGRVRMARAGAAAGLLPSYPQHAALCPACLGAQPEWRSEPPLDRLPRSACPSSCAGKWSF